MNDFFRFPHTPHIAWLAAGVPRDDKVLSPAEVTELLAGEVVVEEKLDGANLGFSVSTDGVLRVQNRGQYLLAPYHGQFARLGPWLPACEDKLFDALGTHLMAFGEWCAARHSLDYVTLPDWWLLFDVYDRKMGQFWSTRRRNAWAAELGLMTVPQLHSGRLQLAQLYQWVQAQGSQFRPGHLEGLVIRRENLDWLEQRAKLVRVGFIQTIESHWRSHTLQWNQLEHQHVL